MKKALIIFGILLSLTANSNAGIFRQKTFFGSLRADEVNLRTGPGREYPIKYVYKLKDLPIQVLGEYESWYEVVDKDGDEGWINKNLLTKKRSAIVVSGTQILYASNREESRPIYRLEKDVIVKFKKCKKNWCKVEVEGKKGWVMKDWIWGVE